MTAPHAVNSLQPIQAYLSHSYRAEDRNVNLFFWRLFSQHKFFFTVDPKSERTFIPHLERMVRLSDCFIAIVTRRFETRNTIGNIRLPQPQLVLTHSPYIEFENRLSIRSHKPRLVFVESELDANLFGPPSEVVVFERDTLEKRKHLYEERVQEFANMVRDYKQYTDRLPQRTRKAGLLLGSEHDGVYSSEVHDLIKEALRVGGYTVTMLSPHVKDDQAFIRQLSELELLVSEVREPYVNPTALAFVHAHFVPTIRICYLKRGERNATLPDFLTTGYHMGDIVPVVTWHNPDELVWELVQHAQKFQQSRMLLDTFDEGQRYFLSAGRRDTRVFISNAHTLNDLALELVKGFQTVNIQFFQYQSSLRIGSTWQDELERELKECNVFIALISEEYHNSQWCRYELETAFKRWQNDECVILPYLITQTRLPEIIKDHIQCAFMHTLQTSDIVKDIVNTVDEYLTVIEQTSPLTLDRVGEFDRALDSITQTTSDHEFMAAVAQTIACLAQDLAIKPHKQAAPQLQHGICRVDVNAQGVFDGLINFPDTMPFFFLRAEPDLDELKKQLMSHSFGLVIAPDMIADAQPLRHLLETQLRQVHACDVAVLKHITLKGIMRSANVDAAFRRAILSRVNILNYTPFIVTGATPERVFFGREAELRTITEQAGRASYALIGGRRIGKTSTLTRLHRSRLPDAGYRVLYHDASTTPTYEALMDAPVRDWQPEPPHVPPLRFRDLLREPPTDKPLVLLIDEADSLVASDQANGWRLFNQLRALANGGCAQVVLSGARTLWGALHNSSGPLFNFTNELLIGRLAFANVAELVTQPMRQMEITLEDESSIVQRIWDVTSGHPNIVQRLCRKLIGHIAEREPRRIALSDVEAVVTETDFVRQDFLATYLSQASVLEHLCVLVMASQLQARTLKTLYETLMYLDLDVTLNQIDDTLESLVSLRNILRHTPQGYEFDVAAFPKIVAQLPRLSDLIELRREIYASAGDIDPETAPPELRGKLW
jgi:hypothetical protein